MKRYLLIVSLTLMAGTAFAQSTITGSVSFIIKNAGINVDGTLEGINGNIDFDMNNPTKGSISIALDAATVNTGVRLRDKHLKKEDYFDVEQYPVIKMESSSLSKKDNGNYQGYFILTMKGKSKELLIQFNVTKKEERLHFNAEFEIDRQDFDIGSNSWVLFDDVKIRVELVVEQ